MYKSWKPKGNNYISPKGIAFPIGMVIITVNNNNPSNWTYGTWERFGEGRCLVGFDSSQTEFNSDLKTGGSKYLQAHYHDLRFGGENGNGVVISYAGGSAQALSVDNWSWRTNSTNEKGSSSNLYTNCEGTGNSQNLQPYITVYFWRRIS